jgi:hypothetical protein
MPPKVRGSNFSRADTECLLRCVEEILPCGQDQWDRVTTQFNRLASFKRNTDSLRAKFKVLRNSRKPTGDPDIPPAKRIQKLIEEHISTKTLDDFMEDDENSSLTLG